LKKQIIVKFKKKIETTILIFEKTLNYFLSLKKHFKHKFNRLLLQKKKSIAFNTKSNWYILKLKKMGSFKSQ